MPDCEICKCKNQGHRPWVEGDKVFRVCAMCSFFRYGRTKAEMIRHARKICRNRSNPKKTPHKDYVVDKKVFNKRRESLRRSDIRHGCDPSNTMTQKELYTFVKNHPCFYCGGPATGIDRQSWEVCYTAKNLKNREKMLACCVLCNSIKREKPRNVFVGKMNRIAAQNPPR